jgi:arginyl-tRNA synthetase
MLAPLKPILALLCGPLLAASVAACGSTVSTSGYKGEDQEVAQAIANLQSDVKAGEEQKICSNDLASPVVARLDKLSGGCRQAIKNQLAEIDSLEVTVQAVQVTSPGHSANARVKSSYAGKQTVRTVALVKEGKRWKLLSLV